MRHPASNHLQMAMDALEKQGNMKMAQSHIGHALKLTQGAGMAGNQRDWMQGAVPAKHQGLFTKKAKKAGESTQEFAQEKAHAPGKLGKEARFAKIAHTINLKHNSKETL